MEKFTWEKFDDANKKTDEEIFREYFYDLDLEPADFERDLILDVGSSQGQFAKWAKDHQVSSKIISIDSSKYFATDSKKQFLAKGQSAVADARHLPFRNNSFDLIVSKHSVITCYFSDKNIRGIELALSEMLRVLKNSGALKIYPVFKKDEVRFDEILEQFNSKNPLEILKKIKNRIIRIKDTNEVSLEILYTIRKK